MTNEQTTDVTGSLQAIIAGVDETVSLENPVFAVNWFDTKSAWLYFIYNVFAAPSVLAVGGKVVIKGKVTSVLLGDVEDRRDMLLVVRYPSASRFLEMLRRRSFQAASVLRSAAVKRFNFGFMQPTAPEAAKPDPKKSLSYLVCHFRGANIRSTLADLAYLHGAVPVFSGKLAARLGTRNDRADTVFVPCPMDSTVIWQASNPEIFKTIVSDPNFVAASETSESIVVATFDRLM